ncbi:MAG TPA: ISAs1 family transposase [Desulfotomaculum sp.]|nr:ISAs1 family transposase [Desulfotomaculum sp.]
MAMKLMTSLVSGCCPNHKTGRWLLTARHCVAPVVADGKPVHLVSAFLHHEKIVIGQRQVDKKSNEITAFKPLLEPIDLKGSVGAADAMHTQVEHARFIVEDKKADYVFPVKL